MINPIIAIIFIGCLKKADVVVLYDIVEERIDVIHVHREVAHGCWCCRRARDSNTVVNDVVDVVQNLSLLPETYKPHVQSTIYYPFVLSVLLGD